MTLEVRMSDDGRTAVLFQRDDVDKKWWFVVGWQDNAGITVWNLADSDVEGWTVLYRKED